MKFVSTEAWFEKWRVSKWPEKWYGMISKITAIENKSNFFDSKLPLFAEVYSNIA